MRSQFLYIIEESNSSVPLTHHDPRDLRLICLEKKRKIRFGFKNPILDFLKKRTLSVRLKEAVLLLYQQQDFGIRCF